MKDEFGGQIIKEIVGLKAKTYRFNAWWYKKITHT